MYSFRSFFTCSFSSAVIGSLLSSIFIPSVESSSPASFQLPAPTDSFSRFREESDFFSSRGVSVFFDDSLVVLSSAAQTTLPDVNMPRNDESKKMTIRR